MIKSTEYFYSEFKEPQQSCLLAVRNIILSTDTNLVETQKWGIPCFCYKNIIICCLSTDKKTKEPYILFFDGNRINHASLEKGNRKRMKIIRINPDLDLPVSTIHLLLNFALNIHKTDNF